MVEEKEGCLERGRVGRREGKVVWREGGLVEGRECCLEKGWVGRREGRLFGEREGW